MILMKKKNKWIWFTKH